MTIYRHPLARKVMYYSELVNQMADEKQAHWLVDAIASHVKANPEFKLQCRRDERFRDMQIWLLIKDQHREGQARLIAVADTLPEDIEFAAIQQQIEYTDFPFDKSGEFKLYCGLTELENHPAYYLHDPSEY